LYTQRPVVLLGFLLVVQLLYPLSSAHAIAGVAATTDKQGESTIDAIIQTKRSALTDATVTPAGFSHNGRYYELEGLILNGDFELGTSHWKEQSRAFNGNWTTWGGTIITGGIQGYSDKFAYITHDVWLTSNPFFIPMNSVELFVLYNYRLVYWLTCSTGHKGVGVYLTPTDGSLSHLVSVHVPQQHPNNSDYQVAWIDLSESVNIKQLSGKTYTLDFIPQNDDPDCDYALFVDNVDVFAGIDTTQYRNFVTRMYTRALGRSAETSGVDYWYGRLYNGETSKLGIIDAFIRTPEYYRTYTRGIYEEFMGRTADTPGLNYWTGRMEQGLTKVQLIEQFAYSPEYLGQSPSKFVDALYQNFMNRKADTAGKNFYLNRMASQGNTAAAKREVIQDFLYSYEFNAKYVQEEYQSILGRKTDSTGEQFFVGQLQQGLDRLQLTAQLLDSQEFWNK